MKKYNAPSLKVKEFDRISMLDVSAGPTNAQMAEKFLKENGATKVISIAL